MDKNNTVQKMHSANADKSVDFYNLHVTISFGYHVKSKEETRFRQWATQQLDENNKVAA